MCEDERKRTVEEVSIAENSVKTCCFLLNRDKSRR